MSAITNIRCALTQKALDAFCTKFHIPDEMHPVLPNQNDTMHERTAGKIGLFTKFFDYANFRLPLSTFLVDVLRHVRFLMRVVVVFKRNKKIPRVLEKGTNIQPVVEVVAPVQPRRQGKRKFVVVDAGGASHPLKKLREDHGTLDNAEVGVAAIPTLPFVTESVSSMPGREVGDHTDSVAEPNLRTIGASQRFVISSDSSHHSGPTIAEAEVDSLARSSVPIMTIVTTVTSTVDPALVAKEKSVKPSLFSADSSLQWWRDHKPNTGVFSNLTSSGLLFVTNGSRLDDGRVCREMVDEFSPPKFFASVRGMENDQLFIEFNVGAACQICLSVEVRMRAEYNVKERRRLKSVVEKQDELLKRWVSSSGLQEKVTVYENCMEQLEKFQDDRMKVVSDKFDKRHAEFVEMALHLEEKFYPHLLTTISAIEKGMQDELSTGITHGKEGRVLTDVAAHNPSAEVDYIAALQRLQNVNFPLLGELKSSKDASIEAVMNILRLEDPLAEKLGLNELQPHVDQLMVPIHHSPDKVVIGATALSLALDVSSIRVRKIKENITNQRSVLHDVFVPLSEPLSAAVLTGTEGTSNTVPATADTTTTLSTTFAYSSTIDPISVDD
ncbi:hypothetical protein Tco_0361172 [Tanacetum coccineum]